MANAKNLRGGKRKGAGRKPDWLKEKCAKLVDRNRLLEYLARVAAGKETDRVLVKFSKDSSEIEEIPCTTKDRLHAIEILLERGFGKPTETVEMNVKGDLALEIRKARQRVGAA